MDGASVGAAGVALGAIIAVVGSILSEWLRQRGERPSVAAGKKNRALRGVAPDLSRC
jgi:hypothetical protein